MATTDRFERLIEVTLAGLVRDWEYARDWARAKDSQRAGHEGEASWARFLGEWGPRCTIATRKYIAGPGGSTNEIDLVLLHPDYPRALLDQPTVLASGVVAAFSVKTTLRRGHLAEALRQKQRLLDVIGGDAKSLSDAMCGPIRFGLLAHKSGIALRGEVFHDAVQDEYERAFELIGRTRPSEALDALLVADRQFFSTSRAFIPSDDGLTVGGTGLATLTSLNAHAASGNGAGAQLVAFLTWLHQLSSSSPDGSPVASLQQHFGEWTSQGIMRLGPVSDIPAHLLRPEDMLNRFGHSNVFM